MKCLIVSFFISFALFGLPCYLCYADDNKVVIGNSEEEVAAAMGEPSGRVSSENIVILEYPSVVIHLKDDRVVDLWKNKAQKPAPVSVETGFVKAVNEGQKNQAVSKPRLPKKTKKEKKTKKYKKIKTINRKGKRVDLSSLLVPGKITIIDFYAQWCGHCRVISPKLEKLARKYKDVYLRKVNIKNWKTPVVKQFQIKGVPNVRIYDRDGKMVGEPASSFKYIKWYIDKLVQS